MRIFVSEIILEHLFSNIQKYNIRNQREREFANHLASWKASENDTRAIILSALQARYMFSVNLMVNAVEYFCDLMRNYLFLQTLLFTV